MEVKGMIAIGATALCLSSCGKNIETETQWVTIDNEAAISLQEKFPEVSFSINQNSNTSLIALETDSVLDVSEFMHNEFNRCGGFFAFDTEAEAENFQLTQESAIPVRNYSYQLDQKAVVQPLLAEVAPEKIKATIEHLSTYHNRYFSANTGVDSQTWLKDTWVQMLANRDDASVELFQHSWAQPSVIATIKGTENPDQIIIIGGHGDSISGWFDRETSRAPGADDNASGIATVTEVMRVLVDNNFKPKKTIMFMSYAAEEVGLRGSEDIASQYRSAGKEVVAVMQLDMTNHIGQSDKISLIRDHTNDPLSVFTGQLIDEYVGVNWINDKCGYGCSDHASWTSNGYPSAFPFEATFNEASDYIHSPSDTLDNADNSAQHAAKFAKLGVAFAIEISK